MATYKVIQDIEAEDKLVGPLSFRQFVYALIAVFCLYISFICVTKHVAFLLVLFVPPAIFTGFLAFPFGRDQPTEVWALAKLRFMIKPHKRIWDQSGVKELVTITVPKKVEVVRTNGLDESEVKSRLHTLADTIDSRGWAIKNVNVNLYSEQNPLTSVASDRLLDVSNVPQLVPDIDIAASDDMLDEESNPVAHHMEQMINASTEAHHKQLLDEMNTVQQPQPAPVAPLQAATQPAADYWFSQNTNVSGIAAAPQLVNPTVQTPSTGVPSPTISIPQPSPIDEQALLEHIRQQNDSQRASYAHLRTLQPVTQTPAPQPQQYQTQVTPQMTNNDQANGTTQPPAQTASTSSQVADPAILSLANNNDLNVATLAREANKARESDEQTQDEVVISLH